MDTYVLQMAEWLEKKIREAELKDSIFTVLKDKVRETTEAVRLAQGDSVAPALIAQNNAIWALIDHQSVRTS